MPTEHTSIIDNRGENTLLCRIQRMGDGGRELWIATAFFSLDALGLLADTIQGYDRIRILFGDDANPRQRAQLLQRLRRDSDEALVKDRETQPLLSSLQKIDALFAAGKIEARCYTKQKFHAKGYLVQRTDPLTPQAAVIGSGNFTRPGLLQNVELDVQLGIEQTVQFREWYEEMWEEAHQDVVTEDVRDEIRRQIELYEPHVLYLKALQAWGMDRQGIAIGIPTTLTRELDKHQEDGYLQGLKIIERQHGVMICDGVGLGKSFIALALMEHLCRDGNNVLLLAPKNIMTNSWDGYLERYLSDYMSPFGNISNMAMTELGFDPEDVGDGDLLDAIARKRREVFRLCERADVIVVDESHNFRTRSANRYKNLMRIVAPNNGKRKKVILLTATPINTSYEDLSAQLALITHEKGAVGAYNIEQIRKVARQLDLNKPEIDYSGQLALKLGDTPSETLNKVLEQVVIQRSRKTCKELSRAVGRPLRFPKRKDPQVIEYTIGPASQEYRNLIEFAHKVFRPGVVHVQNVKKALEEARAKGEEFDEKKFAKGPSKGIGLGAFLLEQYRLEPKAGMKQYNDEVHLAGLVFANTLKQLESSPPAFQGIIQSLALGLIARLQLVFGDDVRSIVDEHQEWIRTPLFKAPEQDTIAADDPDIIEDGDTLDASGEEVDAWLQQAVKSRGLQKKLAEFTAEAFDVERWKKDIASDLGFLRQVHEAVLRARKQPDPKLEKVIPVIAAEREKDSRVLVFTQSRRTAEYLERELAERFGKKLVARIDSRVEDTRAAILYSFCPMYNPKVTKESVSGTIKILVSTDVLSEGVNLQEAGAILNYDIHWNPVRLIQRIGRVDRRLSEDDFRKNPEFAIYNVFPPVEIEKIINLVGSVERRTLKISRALGIDDSFFKANDPAGTLKEFNKLYEGDMRAVDIAATEYARVFDKPDAKLLAKLDAVPPGAFGVWTKAPHDGLFALFSMQPTDRATEEDKKKFDQVIGRPVMAMEKAPNVTTHDAGAILDVLAKTMPGEPSGLPSDEKDLSRRLGKLKNAVRSQFADIELPGTILPRLVCWMEMRKGEK